MHDIIYTENFHMVAALVLSAVVMALLLVSDLSVAAAGGDRSSSHQLRRVLGWLLFGAGIVFFLWLAQQ